MNYIDYFPYSALFYICLLIASLLFAFTAELLSTKVLGKFMIAAVILVLSISAGFRDSTVGLDTVTYIRAIESTSTNYSGELYYKYFEFGFQILIKMLMFLFNNPYFVMFILSLLTNSLIIYTLWMLRDKASFVFSVYCYFVMYYFQTYNITRQWLAIAIVFFAIRYLIKSNYRTFIILTIVACTIHTSALVCLFFIPIHMVIKGKISLKYIVLSILMLIMMIFFPSQILDITGLSNIIEKYQDNFIYINNNETTEFGFYFLIRLSIIIFAFFLLEKNERKEEIIFKKQIIFMCLCGLLLTMLGYFYKYIDRIGSYVTIYEVVLYAMKSRRGHLFRIIKFGIIILGLYLLYRQLKDGGQGQMPYRFFSY